jgi:O-antigen/teichoic acid export membrane protein
VGIVVRQSLKGTFINYIGVLLGVFVQLYIVTKYLDPEVIGLTKVIYEVAFLCSTFALFGSSSSAMRFFPYFRNASNGNNGFLFYFLLLPALGCLIFGGIYCALRTPIIHFFGQNSPIFADYFYWVLPLMVVLTFWVFFENYSNIHMRIVVPKAVREIGMRLLLLACYLLYAFGWVNVSGLLVGCIVSYALCMLTTGSYALHVGERTLRHDWAFITPDLRRKFTRYTLFLLVSAISGNIMGQLDLFMLSAERGMYSSGVYTIVLYMAAIIEMPSRSISAISSPLAATALKEGDVAQANKLYQQVSIHQLLASSILLLLVWVNLDNIFAVIPNGEKFAEGRYAILFLGLAKIVYGTLNFGNILVQYSKYYYWTLYITLFLTLLTIATNKMLIPVMGITGAALATLITCIVSCSYQQFLVQRKVHANPFTWATVRQFVVVGLLYGANCLLPSLSDISPWLDIAVRSGILAVLALMLLYVFHVSEPINEMLRRALKPKQP